MTTRAQRRRTPARAATAGRPLEVERPPSIEWRLWAGAAALVLAAILIYLPTLRGALIWDDRLYLDNPVFRSAGALWQFWINRTQMDYLPLTFSGLWLQWQAWGEATLGFHLVSVLLHAAGAIAAWRVLVRLRVRGAFVAAALFLVHPTAVESVAWIAEQKTLLCYALAMTSLLLYLRFDESGDERGYWASLALFFLALAAKPSAVTLPLVLLLAVWWRRGRIARDHVARSAPFFAIAAAASAVTIWFQQRVIGGRAMPMHGVAGRAAQATKALWFYLGEAAAPHGQVFFYPRWAHEGFDLAAAAGMLVLATAIAAGWKFRRGWGRGLLFALGCFVALSLPTLGMVNMNWLEFAPVADHYCYFPLIAPLALIAAAGTALAEKRPKLRGAAAVAAILAVGTFAGLSWRHAHDFRDEDTLWRATLQRNPQAWAAENGLGMAALNSGDFAGAVEHLGRAVEINPGYAALHTNLGAALQRQHRLDEAAAQYEWALQLNPNVPETHYDLGLVYLAQQRLPQAEEEFARAAQLDPQSVAAESKLAQTLELEGRLEEAERHYARAVQLNPGSAEAHEALALCLRKMGRMEEALAEHRGAMLLQGRSAQ